MSTRGMVCLRFNRNGGFELWYRHTDTYPNGLGMEIITKLKDLQYKARYNGREIEAEDIYRMLEDLGCTPEKVFISKPEDAFYKRQGDLEYIHVLDINLEKFGNSSYTILRTSNPWFDFKFAYPIYGSYIEFLPPLETANREMKEVERISDIALDLLRSFKQAENGKTPYLFF